MKGADGIIYVYDITQKSSFDNLKSWIRSSEESTEGFKKLIAGNKSDLEIDRVIQKESLIKYCEDKNIKGLEVSAKTGSKVNEAFETLARLIVGKMSKEEIIKKYSEIARDRGLSINDKENKKEKKKCC